MSGRPRPPASDYVELHAHSNFSFLDGASPPHALAARAAELGMPALALTDHQGLYGAVKHARACAEAGLRPIFGAEITLVGNGADEHKQEAGNVAATAPTPGGHLTLLVENERGWRNLCRLLSEAGLAGNKHVRPVTWAQLANHAAGLICLSGCRDGVVAGPARRGDRAATVAAARRLKAIFGVRHCFVELQRHFDRGDRRLGATLLALAEHLELETVATNNVHYATPEGFRLQHVLACIRRRETLDEAAAKGGLYATPHRYLKSAARMRELFADRPRAVANTLRIAERCDFNLDLRHARLPAFPLPGDETAFEHLLGLCNAGLRRKFRPVTPAAAEQLARELGVIERRGLAEYFLVVHDIVAFARREGIPCQGRGSAAGSVVAYVLDITPVDPLAHGLLFERFLSEGSHATPDIDVDFAADRREEVLQYVYRRWGAERTAMVANVVTFRARSAVADVGKALGFPADLLSQMRRHLHTRAAADVAIDLAEVEPFQDKLAQLPWRQLVDLCAAIDGFPRHLSIHTGGMIVTREPLCELVPLEPATMPGRVVVQWDKDDVEDAGLIKIDLLSLRTLGLVGECFELVRRQGASGAGHEPLHELDLAFDTVPTDDESTWEMIRAADTIGCFQIESRAQLALQPRLQASEMADLVVAVSLIRPGPIEGGMAKAYLRRRFGEEPVSYWHPLLEPVLEETLGILIYQEQVLRVSMVLAGFSGAQADGLRRSMSRKRGREEMERWRADFVTGAAEREVSADVAHHVFDHLRGFASYGFCKSHAAAFARLTWVTAWLKCHHPLPFYCAMLNAQPMGFYTVEAVVEDARRHGIALRAAHVNRSAARWTIEAGEAGGSDALRVPLSRVRGLSEEVAETIVAARTGEQGRSGDRTATAGAADGASATRPFASLWDFVRRARPPRHLVERLVRAGAMDGLPTGVAQRERSAAAHPTTPAPPATSPATSPTSNGPAHGRDGNRIHDHARQHAQQQHLDRDRRTAPDPAAHPTGPGPDRRQLLWALGEMRWQEGELALRPVVVTAPLPPTDETEAVLADYSLLGVAQGRHVLALLRPGLAEEGATACEDVAALPHDAPVRVAGRLEVLQRPQTAKGIVFATIEDETGMANLVCYPDVFEGFRQVVRDHAVLIADGRIQQEHGVTHVIVRRLRGVRLEAEAAGEAAVGPKWGTASGPGAASGSRRGAVVGPGKEFE